jgi:hypothetical protein
MSNIDKAAEHLGANALKMIKLILLKHDAAIIEASQEAIEAAVLAEREACKKIAVEMANTQAKMNQTWRNACMDVANEIEARGRA